MKVSKRIIIPAIGMTMAGSLYGATKVSAAVSPTRKSLAQDLADTFHLDPSKVQAVVTEHRTEVSQNRQAAFEQRLDAAVTAGQLTAAQKTAIEAEHTKLQSELQSDLANDPTNHAQALMQMRQDATTWAQQNNIDVSWVLPGGGRRGHRGMPGATGSSNGATSAPMPAPAPQPTVSL